MVLQTQGFFVLVLIAELVGHLFFSFTGDRWTLNLLQFELTISKSGGFQAFEQVQIYT